MSKLELLRQFAEQIKKSYGAVSLNIQGVVEVLNSDEGVDKELKKHIGQIIASLELIEREIIVERGLADDAETLRLLKDKIKKIKSLRSYLKLAEKNPNHSVIVAINNLNNSLIALFAKGY